MSVPRPLLLIDVDGPIIPDRRTVRRALPPLPDHYETHRVPSETKGQGPRSIHLSSEHATALQGLRSRFTLIWATAWQDEANRVLSPLLGLPTDIPVIRWPLYALDYREPVEGNGSWKTHIVGQWLDDFARGLPWAWFDDEITHHDDAWFDRWYANHAPAPRLLLPIPAREGLNGNHFDQLHEFADTL